MRKKSIAFLLVVSMIFLIMLPFCAAGAANDGEEKIAEPATERMRVLQILGIYSGEMLEKAAEQVTRKDFAEVAVRFYGLDVLSANSRYDDVDEKSAQYVVTAVESELMDDGLSGSFNADKAIVGADVIRLVIKSLGYNMAAKYYGGYIPAARSLNLCKNVNKDAEITFSKLADILVDALYEKVAAISYSKDILFEKSDERYIEAHFDAQALKGKVEATDMTALDSPVGAGKGKVKISSELYNTELDMNPYLGCEINFITINNEQTEKRKLIYVYPDYNSRVVQFSAADIVSYSGNLYKYYDGEKMKRANLDTVKTVIYNGVEWSGYTASDLEPEYGDIRLVDTDYNGRYDVVFINEYRTLIVASTDRKEYKIYDTNGELPVTYEDADFLKVLKDGAEITVDSIKQGNILQVYESKTGKSVSIKLSTKKVKGSIAEYAADEDNSIIKIDNNEYKLCYDYFSKYVKNIRAGMEVSAYINSEGLLVFLENEVENSELGFLKEARKSERHEVIGEALVLSIFTSDNKIEVFYSKDDKIKIDGKKMTIDSALEALSKGTGEVMPQLIRYKKNNEGEITEIDTPYNNQPLEVDPTPLTERIPNETESASSFRIIFSSYIGTNTSKLWYKSAAYTFGRVVKVVADNAATVVVAPAGTAQQVRQATEDDFRFYLGDPSKYFKNDSEYKIEAYSFDDGFTADVILVRDESNASKEKPTQHIIRMIRKIKTVLRNDEVVTELTVVGTGYSSTKIYATEDKFCKAVYAAGQSYSDPANKVLYDKDEQTYELGVGDIIWYDLNSRDEITVVRLIYDASETEPLKAFKASSRLEGDSSGNDPMPRQMGDILDYPGIQFFDVYEIKDGYARVTYENLKDGSVKNPENLDFNIATLKDFGDDVTIFLDKRENKYQVMSNGQINNGGMTYRDIKDYKVYGENCHRVIQVRKWGYSEAQFVIIE